MKNKTVVASFVIAGLMVSMAGCNYSRHMAPEESQTETVSDANAFTADSFAFYENILRTDSVNVPLQMALASNYYADRKFNEAIDHLLKVYGIDNKNLEMLVMLGNVYYDAGLYDNAVIYYEKALVLDNSNVNVRCDLATCYLNLKKPEISEALLKKNLSIAPNHPQTHHNLSVVYSQMGRDKEAEEQMKVFNALVK